MSAGPDGPTHERVAYQNRRSGANNARSSDRRQDLGTIVGHGNGVLEMGGQRAVDRRDRPAVRAHRDLAAAEREHRLDREADAGGQLHAPDAGPVVWDMRLLLHLGRALEDDGNTYVS